MRLVFEEDEVRLDGHLVAPRTSHTHAVLNKPLGVTSTARDPDGKADLSPWLERMPAGTFPIGRLDRMTSGLLLFTSDGDLANAVLRPEHHTDKLYWLWLNEHVTDDDPRLLALLRGIEIQGRLARAERVSVLARTPHVTELNVTLREGRNRQIRRMCRALDFYLVGLHRKAIGPIHAPDLPLGAFRHLDPHEVEALWGATGGREHVRQRKLRALVRHAARQRAAGKPHARLEAWLERARPQMG